MGADGVGNFLNHFALVMAVKLVVAGAGFQFDDFVFGRFKKDLVNAGVVIAFKVAFKRIFDVGAGGDAAHPWHEPHHFAITAQRPAQDAQGEEFAGVGFVAVEHFQAVQLRCQANE